MVNGRILGLKEKYFFFCKKPTIPIGIQNNASYEHLTHRYNDKKYCANISIESKTKPIKTNLEKVV